MIRSITLKSGRKIEVDFGLVAMKSFSDIKGVSFFEFVHSIEENSKKAMEVDFFFDVALMVQCGMKNAARKVPQEIPAVEDIVDWMGDGELALDEALNAVLSTMPKARPGAQDPQSPGMKSGE
jgi:hypothetical protein